MFGAWGTLEKESKEPEKFIQLFLGRFASCWAPHNELTLCHILPAWKEFGIIPSMENYQNALSKQNEYEKYEINEKLKQENKIV